MAWTALVGPEIEENLSLRYLAAALARAGERVEVVPYNGPADFNATLARLLEEDEAPAVVAISLSFQWRASDCLALAVALRQRGYRGHITGGGHFGTFAAADLLTDFPELDTLCRHEAEETLVELVRAVRAGGDLALIPGLALRDAAGRPQTTPLRAPPDLATLAWPVRFGAPSLCLGHRVAALIGSRGCYARCAFCCIAAWHEQTLPGKRYRLRPVEDIADEMAALARERGVDTFIFHDDNFFLPTPERSLARIEALADALEARGVGRIATVVKARPPDVTRPVFEALTRRLGLVRVFLGIETDADQGLRTLQRRVVTEQNHAAMRVLRELGVYVCYNLLVFDPDTTLESLETNLAFMRAWGDSPFNFGRVELYAGTPLLARMQRERRCSGDYLGWDYTLGDPRVQRVFELAVRAFYPRNFAPGALANRLMGTRFDVEMCRHFHPAAWRPAWLLRARELSRALALDSVQGLERLVAHARRDAPADEDAALLAGLGARLRATEAELAAAATRLEDEIQAAVGAGCRHTSPARPDARPEALEVP